ncbi:unnamed protein product, partial [Ectocarpus fasciculatus]
MLQEGHAAVRPQWLLVHTPQYATIYSCNGRAKKKGVSGLDCAVYECVFFGPRNQQTKQLGVILHTTDPPLPNPPVASAPTLPSPVLRTVQGAAGMVTKPDTGGGIWR